ncbi:unnamed protein product [Malus baccata var. baccata]
MVLTDVDGTSVWETTASSSSSRVETIMLMDSGNLVLRDKQGKVLWQSFDFPTHTLLPNQPLTKSKKMISISGKGTFGTCYFSFSFDNDNVLKLIDKLQFRAFDAGSSAKMWLMIDYVGNLKLYSLKSLCKVHGICINTTHPKCSCRPGYEVADTSDWKKGCKRNFNRLQFYGYYLNYSEPISVKNCNNLYLDDFRCEAFSYRKTGEGKCYTNSALFKGHMSPNFPGSIYIRLPLSVETSLPINLKASNTCRKNVIMIVVGSHSMYVSTAIRVRWLWHAGYVSEGTMQQLRRKMGYHVISSQFRKFCYAELKKATKNFKEELGIGISGDVYKGILADERVVAAKVSTIGKINHMNLVRIWGFCFDNKHKLLISKYVQNGLLDKHLFPLIFLGWQERFKCLKWVIHCDVNPENILQARNFELKIADFGLAKLTQRGNRSSLFSQIRGTKRSMVPEWAINHPITAKVDVYGYGVVLLEIVKGIRLSSWAVEDTDDQESELTRFVRVAKRKIHSGKDLWIEDVIDQRLQGQFSRIQVAKMRSKRPTMDSVVNFLLECEGESSVACEGESAIAFEGESGVACEGESAVAHKC